MRDSIRDVVGCVVELAGIHDQCGRDLVGPRYSVLSDECADVRFVEVSVWPLSRKSFAGVGQDVSGESGCAGVAECSCRSGVSFKNEGQHDGTDGME